jgi:hypothetical protein
MKRPTVRIRVVLAPGRRSLVRMGGNSTSESTPHSRRIQVRVYWELASTRS